MENTNNRNIKTGRLIADAKTFSKDGKIAMARFTIIRHVGKEPLFVNCVMSANLDRKNERELPLDKLTKGTLVRVSGFDKPNNWVGQDGKKFNSVDLHVLDIEFPAPKEEEPTNEEAEAPEEVPAE